MFDDHQHTLILIDGKLSRVDGSDDASITVVLLKGVYCYDI